MGSWNEKKYQLEAIDTVICNKSDKRRTYNAVTLRVDVKGMGGVGPGKFLFTRSGSLKGDKLMYDEIETPVCA